jgi:hypothetical protein
MSLFGSLIPQFQTEYNGTACKKPLCSYNNCYIRINPNIHMTQFSVCEIKSVM